MSTSLSRTGLSAEKLPDWGEGSERDYLSIKGGVPHVDPRLAAAALWAASGAKRLRVVGANYGSRTSGNPGTDYSASSRLLYTANGPLSQLCVTFDGGNATSAGGGSEATMISSQIIRCSLEYPLGSTPVYFTFRGRTTGVCETGSSGLISDVLGVNIPNGAQFAIRTFARVPRAPTSPSATPTAGGSLAAQTWYYTLTTVDNGIESGPVAEFSGTTAAGNLSNLLAWTAPAYGDEIRVYRSPTAGGTKQYIGKTDARSQQFMDNGSITANSAVNPPVANGTLRLLRYLLAGESANTQYGGGNGSDQTGVSGAITGQVGPSGTFAVGPELVIGDASTPTYGGDGDSIQAGVGISNTNIGQFSSVFSSWFAQGMNAQSNSWYNHSIGGAALRHFFDGSRVILSRQRKTDLCDRFISNLGFNDIVNGGTWSQLAADHIARSKPIWARGQPYYLSTVTPRSTTTDLYITAANQTVHATNGQRILFNRWVRGGCQVDGSGAPVQSGGTPCPSIAGYFDAAAVIEVDSSNRSSLEGGLWKAPSAASFTGQVLTGTPSTTALAVSGTPYPVRGAAGIGLLTQAVRITSGAAAGQVAVISDNTNNSLTLYANASTTLTGIAMAGLTIAPAAGDTFEIWPVWVLDGSHPSYYAHSAIGAAFASWLGLLQ